jgi:hypothetical protein
MNHNMGLWHIPNDMIRALDLDCFVFNWDALFSFLLWLLGRFQLLLLWWIDVFNN